MDFDPDEPSERFAWFLVLTYVALLISAVLGLAFGGSCRG